MLIILSDLVNMCKIERNTYFQTRSEKLHTIQERIYLYRPPLWMSLYWMFGTPVSPQLLQRRGGARNITSGKFMIIAGFGVFWSFRAGSEARSIPKITAIIKVGLDQRVCFHRQSIAKKEQQTCGCDMFKGPYFRHVYCQLQTSIYTPSPCFSFNCLLESILTVWHKNKSSLTKDSTSTQWELFCTGLNV